MLFTVNQNEKSGPETVFHNNNPAQTYDFCISLLERFRLQGSQENKKRQAKVLKAKLKAGKQFP